MKIYLTVLILLVTILSGIEADGQNKGLQRLIGGPCEGCEAVFEYGNRKLTPVDTLPDFHQGGKKIRITGTIFKPDGKTPAADVILYVYHTDQNGVYATRGDEKGWARRHGYIRGWIKTGPNGKYTFYTLQPGTYPNRSEPAHIQPIILEPDGKYYWLDSYLFAGDSLLAQRRAVPSAPRGGSSGLLELEMKTGILTGYRDIVLGKNIPGYPKDPDQK